MISLENDKVYTGKDIKAFVSENPNTVIVDESKVLGGMGALDVHRFRVLDVKSANVICSNCGSWNAKDVCMVYHIKLEK